MAETPAEVIINEDFAAVRQPLESQTAFSACDLTALSEEQRCVDGVDLGRDLAEKIVLHLRTGCYMGRYDSIGDWPERALKSPALSPIIKRQIVDILHQCLTHNTPIVRIAAMGILDTSSVLRDDRQIVLRMIHNWPLFAGLHLPDDDPTRDRGQDALHMLAARADALEEGLAFVRRMATDKTYGGTVLAALTSHDPEWVVNAIESLITPELDPEGRRLSIIIDHLGHNADHIRRVILALKDKGLNAQLNTATANLESGLLDTRICPAYPPGD